MERQRCRVGGATQASEDRHSPGIRDAHAILPLADFALLAKLRPLLLNNTQITGDVAMRTTIIDARGCLRSEAASGGLAVEDQGGVGLRNRGNCAVEISYRPSAVRPRALLRTVQLLDDTRAWDRYILKVWTDDRHTAFVGNRTAAVAHLMGHTTEAQSTRRGDFSSHRYSLGVAIQDPAFGRLFEAWRGTGGRESQGLIEAVRESSRGRYLGVDAQQGGSRLILDVIGDAYSLYGNGWKSIAVGGLFEDMPDFEYARWAAQGYREAFHARQPIFEEVSAAVRILRRGRLLLTYRRMILPVGGGKHPSRLLGATLDQRVTALASGGDDELGAARLQMPPLNPGKAVMN